MISDNERDSGVFPNTIEAAVAKNLVAFKSQELGDVAGMDAIRQVVEFVSAEFLHDSAEYKNNLMFELTGSLACCKFKD